MNGLENEIKNRLSTHSEMTGVNSEALWSGISEGMTTKGSKRKGAILWWLVPVILFSGILTLTLIPGENVRSEYMPREDYAYQVLKESLTGNEESSKSSIENYSSELHQTYHSPKSDKNEEESPVQNSPSENLTSLSEESTSEADKKLLANVINNDTPSKPEETVKPIKESSHLINSTSDRIQRNEAQPGSNTEITEVNLEELKVVSGLLEKLDKMGLKDEEQTVQASKKKLAFSIYGGTVYESLKFKGSGSLTDSLNQSISTDDGFRVGFSVPVKKGDFWNLSIGAELGSWQDKFEKDFISDTTIVESGSGQVLEAQAIRSVRHFNKHSVVTIPLDLEVFKDVSRFRLSCGFGMSYSFFAAQNGRGLDENNSLVEYNNENKRYGNFLSLRTSPSIGFRVNENVLLSGVCGLSLQSKENLSFSGAESNSLAIMPALRLSFNY